ncbi:hypothetical protein CHELA1G2_12016 [Hyphomicrobiales bacterium]|nr:hypothetical protein CHELA1G2_12016 [Hyphomicrobiales bacterium]
MDQVFLQVFRRELGIGNLAQRDDGIFIPVAIDGQRRAGGDQPGAMAGEEHELETVLDLVDAIFDGDASHERLLLWHVQQISLIALTTPVNGRMQGYSQALALFPAGLPRRAAHLLVMTSRK